MSPTHFPYSLYVHIVDMAYVRHVLSYRTLANVLKILVSACTRLPYENELAYRHA